MALATRVYEEAAKAQQTNTDANTDNSANNTDSDVHEAEYEEK